MARDKDTTEAQIPELSEEAAPDPAIARAARIQELCDRGYTSGNERRAVKSPAHAEFLIRSGVVAP